MRTIILTLVSVLVLCSAALAQQPDRYPNDAQAVAFAVAAKMTRQPVPQTITFDPSTDKDMVGATSGVYAGFTEFVPTFTAYRNDRGGPLYNADLTGFLHIKDPDGRLASLRFVARYTVNGQQIRVYQCVVVTASPSDLALSVFMVPAERFMQLPRDVRSNWVRVFNFARENAYNPQHDPAQKTNYIILTFVMNQLPNDALFEAIVGERKSARRKLDNLAKDTEVYMGYNGWRVHMFRAQLNPTSQRDRFYTNYAYTPGSDVDPQDRDRIQVAQYDSKPTATGPTAPMQKIAPEPTPAPAFASAPAPAPTPQYAPAQQYAPAPAPAQQYAPAPVPAPAPQYAPAQQYAPAPAQAPVQTALVQGPYERGMAFLNPIFPDDVAVIQTRLTELGHYGGPIDRTFDSFTKKALDNFAVKHGFPKGQWSLGLQKALFLGSGL